MTQTELEQLTSYWQDKLRLVDWDITVRYKTQSQLGEAVGRAKYIETLNQATIEILKPEHDEWGTDIEETLVHELLHVKTSGLHGEEAGWLKGAKRTALEVAIDHTARALVALDREKRMVALESKKAQIEETLKLLRGAKGVR